MAYEIPGLLAGQLAADVDMSVIATYQFTAVTVATAVNIVGHGIGNACVKPIGASGLFYGVIQNNPVQGEAATVVLSGITKFQSGGTYAVGDLIAIDANGRAIKAATGNKIVGIALEQSVVGSVGTVLIRPNGTA